MPKMDHDAAMRFLVEKPRTAKLATVRKDGRPHVAPIWFDLDGDTIVFMTWHQSVKGLNIQRDPRVCLIVDDEAPPFAYVQVEGTATLLNDAEAQARWSVRIAGRYMGADQAQAYGKRNAVPGELLVRVTPTKVIGEDDVAGW